MGVDMLNDVQEVKGLEMSEGDIISGGVAMGLEIKNTEWNIVILKMGGILRSFESVAIIRM